MFRYLNKWTKSTGLNYFSGYGMLLFSDHEYIFAYLSAANRCELLFTVKYMAQSANSERLNAFSSISLTFFYSENWICCKYLCVFDLNI